MKKCMRYKNVTDKYGRRVKRCAEFSGSGLSGGSSMSHFGGSMGELPTVWDGYGEGEGFDLDAVLGPAIGGGTALGVTLLTRAFTKPDSKVGNFAGIIGAGAGMVLSVPLGFLRGWNTAIAGMVSAALTGLNCYLATLVQPKMEMAELPAGVEGYGMIVGQPLEGIFAEGLDGYGQYMPATEIDGMGEIVAGGMGAEDVDVYSGYGQDVSIFEGFGEGDDGSAVEVLDGVNFAAFGTNIVS